MVTKLTVNNERCFSTCLYGSLNQNQEQFESFCENLIDRLSVINNQQPSCSILIKSKHTSSSTLQKHRSGMYTACNFINELE